MTTELEKQFFNTLGIKKIFKSEFNEMYPDFKSYSLEYPQITDRILLELICILSQHYFWGEENWFIKRTTIDELKEWLLEEFIEIDKIGFSKIIKHQVQALFKGE